MTADGGRGLTIGAVLARLQGDFPDLTVSKVRFLDTEGLVSPQRRESGYREYSERDIERLRFVLTAQRDRFWPLKVIREALDAYDRGLTPESGAAGAGLPTPPAPADDPSLPTADALEQPLRDVRMTRAEIARGSGLTPEAIAELETFHLLAPGSDGHYGEADLVVARAAQALSAFGVGGRHLRAFRLAADREIGLVQQAAGSRTDQRAEVLAQCLSLHVALVRAGLQER